MLSQVAVQYVILRVGEAQNLCSGIYIHSRNTRRFVTTFCTYSIYVSNVQYGGPVSKEGLMMTHLRYVPAQECSDLHKLEITPDMFCLYGDGARDTCKGDSGGGVFWNE